MPFQTFEHTADVGLRVTAPSLDALFAEAARGFFALLVENPDAIRPVNQIEIALSAEDHESLFVDWLRELLYRFDTEHFLGAEFAVELSDRRSLKARIRGETLDFSRHQMLQEIKAVTYHGLRVDQTPTGWSAEVIFDI